MTPSARFRRYSNNVSQTPPSLPRWNRAFALRSDSCEISIAVVQKPENHRGKLGGVWRSRRHGEAI